MKKSIKIGVVFFVISMVFGGLFVFYSSSSLEERYMNEVSGYLTEIAGEKADRINGLLSQMRNNVDLIAKNENVKDLLSQELVSNESVIKMDVDQRVRIISKEVENYLRMFPDMTLEDLQKSSEFHKIAVQSVGKDGYSALNDYENQVIVMHKFDDFIGRGLEIDIEKLPEIYNLQLRSKKEVDVSGFYDWKDINGQIKRKYARFVHIGVKTADDVGLMVATTAYVEDYKISGNISREVNDYLNNFKNIFDYYNLVLISPEGYVLHMNKQEKGFGTNLGWKVNEDEGISKNYFNVKERQDVSFYGSYIGDYGDIYPKVSIMIPVYSQGDDSIESNNNLLGYVALIDEIDNIFDITERITGIGKTEESYLVNNERLLISPLRNEDFDIMIQSIKTENVEECFEDIEEFGDDAFEEEKEEEDDVRVSENYAGDIIIGTDYPLPELGWCFLIEMHKEEAVEVIVREAIYKRIIFSVLGIFVLTLIGFFIGRDFDRKKR